MGFIKKVAVGISGGVDSAVAAFLIKNKGFQTYGVFMQNWDAADEFGFCSSEKDLKDAELVCKKLKITLHKVDFVKEYWNDVFVKTLSDYENGFTPNPDILCNRHIKFNVFHKYCIDVLNVDAVATGHYANTNFGPFLENYNEHKAVSLLQPKDKNKDQTFFLSHINGETLRCTMFPLAYLYKSEVRDIARRECLFNVANKRDSTGICFIGKRNFQRFIEEYIKPKPGNFIDLDTGQIVGKHDGLHNYTVGQRCKLRGYADAYFVYEKILDNNNIYVVLGTEHKALKSRYCFTEEPNWITDEPSELTNNSIFKCSFRFQHTKPCIACKIMKMNDNLLMRLEEPLRALTRGQYAVLYKDEVCLGSARIIHVGPDLFTLGL